MMNALNKSMSPYLQMHKDNAIAWRPWSDAVLTEAQASGKPIFLSSGYAGCHWCQVMNRESFSDPQTAKLINDNFIPVLLDREERPDLDQIYQAAAALMGHNGGWPLNLFLDATGAPCFVAGYLAKDDRPDRPSLQRVLTDMAAMPKNQAEDVARNTSGVTAQLGEVYGREMRGTLDELQMELCAIRIGQRFDVFMGGLIGPMKFPSVALLEVMWRAFLRTGVGQYLQLITTTMNNMLLSGLYDHVGGGFFRYANDERWMVPHFEKSLCDNALLVNFMTQMWQFNRNDLCKERVSETIGWMLREMTLEGAFASGQSDASESGDGQYYLWSEAEVDAALQGTFSARFKQVYGVQREGDMNGKTLLRRHSIAAPPTEADEVLMAKQRALLLEVRNSRPAPLRGDILLADWNGLAIRALALAGSAFERPEWIAAAVTAYDAIRKLMDDDGVLYHAWGNGQRGPKGFSDDYAHMAHAALQLYEATGDKRYIEHAKAWTRTLDANFWDEARGGYCFTANDAEKLIVRTKTIFDQPTPSANGTMISVLTKLALLTGEHDHGMRAQSVLQAFITEFNRNLVAGGEFLNGFECFATGLQLVVVGKKGNAATQELARTIWGKALPNRLLLQVESTQDLPPGHPAYGKETPGGQPAVFICQRNSCSDAITSAVTLSQTLTLPTQRALGAA